MDTTAQLIETIFSFSRCMRERLGVSSDIAKLSMVQLQTLVFLKKNSGSPMKGVAEYLQVELPSVTSLIDNLVKADLVKRESDKKDKRLVAVFLTEKGKDLLQKAKKERSERIEKVLSPLSSGEKKQLDMLLKKMIDTIESSYER